MTASSATAMSGRNPAGRQVGVSRAWVTGEREAYFLLLPADSDFNDGARAKHHRTLPRPMGRTWNATGNDAAGAAKLF